MTLAEAWDQIDVVIDALDDADNRGASREEMAPLRFQFAMLEAFIGKRKPPADGAEVQA